MRPGVRTTLGPDAAILTFCRAERRNALTSDLRDELESALAAAVADGARVVVVHGAGPQANEEQRALGEEPNFVDGRRVTTPTALEALTASTASLSNALSEALESQGSSAVVLTECALATKRPPMKTSQGVVDFGLVGDLTLVDTDAVCAELNAGKIPLIAPPVRGPSGERKWRRAESLADRREHSLSQLHLARADAAL